MSLWQVPKFLLAKGCRMCRNIKPIRNYAIENYNDVYEPDYLSSMEPDIPIYDSLNIQIKGYDYPLLENYQKLIHKMAKTLDIEVDECWATPCQKLKINKFKAGSAVVDTEYNLSLYERNVQVCDVPSPSLAILLRLVQEAMPQGVTVQVHEALEQHQEIRYVPDNALKALKLQLNDMGGPTRPKKK